MADAEEAYRIAEARIAEAKATGARVLNLSPNDMDSRTPHSRGDKRLQALELIPPELASLATLESLNVSATMVADISPLAGLTSLKQLYISRTQVADLNPLAALSALEAVSLADTKAVDVAPLSGLFALRSLGLSGTQAADLSPLANLTALEELNLSHSPCFDLTPISRLTSIKVLDLSSTKVSNIAPLAGFAALRDLFLAETRVIDLAPLAGLAALEALIIDRTPATDLSPLAGLSSLNTLYLSGTHAADLAPLQSLEGLFFNDPDDDPLRLVAQGSPWEHVDRRLRFLVIYQDALGDDRLRAQVQVGRNNAPAILARLREIRDERAPPSPPAFGPDDWRFETAPDGRMRLSDAPLGADADQAAMQGDLRRRAEALAGALAGSNEFAGLAEDARNYALLLRRDAEQIGAKAVWALSCIFRAALAADEAAEREGRLNDLLPPLARAALTNVVTIGGAWLLDHPGVAEVEAKARNWRATQGEEREAEAALAVLTAIAAQPDAVEPETARTLSALARLGQGSKAVLDATRGLVVFLLRAPVKFVRWSGNGLIWVGGALDGAAKLAATTYIAAQLVVTHEAAIRIWLTAHAPETLRWFDALYRLFRSIGP